MEQKTKPVNYAARKEAPKDNQIVLIIGCGTNDYQGTFLCKPQLGWHHISYGDQVKNYFPDDLLQHCRFPKQIAQHLALDGEVDAKVCYTVNPNEQCNPDYAASFQSEEAKKAIGVHKFSMVYIDRAMGYDELANEEFSEKSIRQAWEWVKPGGVLIVDNFNIQWDIIDSKWQWNEHSSHPDKATWDRLITLGLELINNDTQCYYEAGRGEARGGKQYHDSTKLQGAEVWFTRVLLLRKRSPFSQGTTTKTGTGRK